MCLQVTQGVCWWMTRINRWLKVFTGDRVTKGVCRWLKGCTGHSKCSLVTSSVRKWLEVCAGECQASTGDSRCSLATWSDWRCVLVNAKDLLVTTGDLECPQVTGGVCWWMPRIYWWLKVSASDCRCMLVNDKDLMVTEGVHWWQSNWKCLLVTDGTYWWLNVAWLKGASPPPTHNFQGVARDWVAALNETSSSL